MTQNPYSSVVGFSYAHLSNSATTVIKSAPGMMARIVLNTCGAATITLYDNTAGSGAVIGVLTTTTATVIPTAVAYEANFATGLTAVVSGTVDATVMYR
jgi:hypothetical protein